MKSFHDYVAKKIKSPNSARGEIKIEFYVELNRTFNHFKVVKSINKEMALSAIRLLVNSPKLTLRKIDRKDARVTFGLPINVQ